MSRESTPDERGQLFRLQQLNTPYANSNLFRGRIATRLRELGYGDVSSDLLDVAVDGKSGGCHICSGTNKPGRGLNLDHCHTSGQIRGWLCDRCNRALGGFRDDPDLLYAAIHYLVRANAFLEAKRHLGIHEVTEGVSSVASIRPYDDEE